MEVWGKRTLSASEKYKLRGDRAWLVRTYGAKKNAGCAKLGPALRNPKKKTKRNTRATVYPQRAAAAGWTLPKRNAKPKAKANASLPAGFKSEGITTAQIKRNFWALDEELI